MVIGEILRDLFDPNGDGKVTVRERVMGVVWLVFIAAIFVASASATYLFLRGTYPDNPAYQIFGLAVYEGGLAMWPMLFKYGKGGGLQRVEALAMSIFSLAGVLIAFVMTVIRPLVATSDPVFGAFTYADIFQYVSVGLVVVWQVLTFLMVFVYGFSSHKTMMEIFKQVKLDSVETQAVRLTSDALRKELPKAAKRYAETMADEIVREAHEKSAPKDTPPKAQFSGASNGRSEIREPRAARERDFS